MKNRTRQLFLIIALMAASMAHAGKGNIEMLGDLDPNANDTLKCLRSDVRKTIYTIKSLRSLEEMPELNFYRYRVKAGDTFWTILAKTSLDMDTLISVNNLSMPEDVTAGKTIFVPNMRGIITMGGNRGMIEKLAADENIKLDYITRVNKSDTFDKKFFFIPCGKITELERSLFLGTGFMYPLDHGRATSGFGSRLDPFNRMRFQFHNGIDISCPIRSNVYSAREGTAIFSGYRAGYGYLVIIQHEHGYQTYYGHLSRSLVTAGQTVKTGEVIAVSGNSGRTTGPHLHFEIRKGHRAVNPAALIRHR